MLRRDERAERAIESVGRATEGVIEAETIVVEGLSPVGKARNEGLRRASGEYIAWVDGDDEVTNEWGAEIKKAIEERVDVIIFDAEKIGWNDGREIVYGRKGELKKETVLKDIYRDNPLGSYLWTMVTRRELWREARFDETAPTLEDYRLLPSVLDRAQTFKYLPKRLYRYYAYESSLTHNTDIASLVRNVEVALERREAAPDDYKTEAMWGAATMAYWQLYNLKGCKGLEKGREFIAHNFFALMREAKFMAIWRQRTAWKARLLLAAMNVWWPIRLRDKLR